MVFQEGNPVVKSVNHTIDISFPIGEKVQRNCFPDLFLISIWGMQVAYRSLLPNQMDNGKVR